MAVIKQSRRTLSVPLGRQLEEQMMSIQTPVSDQEIARRAYEIWESRGCPQSDGSDDWQAAVAELSALKVCRNDSTQRRVQSWWKRVREKITAPAYREIG